MRSSRRRLNLSLSALRPVTRWRTDTPAASRALLAPVSGWSSRACRAGGRRWLPEFILANAQRTVMSPLVTTYFAAHNIFYSSVRDLFTLLCVSRKDCLAGASKCCHSAVKYALESCGANFCGAVGNRQGHPLSWRGTLYSNILLRCDTRSSRVRLQSDDCERRPEALFRRCAMFRHGSKGADQAALPRTQD